jgi:D-alanyl-D-alanine-carboxypeptidase/D-alanyl-D-alanine-endopeptidase
VLTNAETGAVMDLGMHMLDGRCGPLWFRHEAKLDPTRFDVLAGCYGLWPGLIFEIAREGDRLYAQLTGQRRLRLFPTSAQHFFYKFLNAQMTFGPRSSGRPSYLILHQNGRDRIAARIP